jgi:CBS domain-containing protein
MPDLTPTDPVESLVGGPVATIRPTATLREAAESLAADGVGLLVVVDASGVRGVLSERDIVHAIAEDLDLTIERVLDSATTDLLTIDETASITAAAQAMSKAEIRHLAITRKGVVTGVVSIRDVVNVLLDAQD